MNDDQNFHDLDERARSAVTDLTTRATARPAPAFDPDRPVTVPVSSAPPARFPNRRPLFAVAAAVVVAMLAAGLWIGTRGDDTDVADDVVSGSIQPYLPEVLPAGMELAAVAESDGTGDPELYDNVGPLSTFGPATDDPRVAVLATSERSFEPSTDSGSSDGPVDDGTREVAVGDRIGYLQESAVIPGLLLEVAATDDPAGPYVSLFGPEADVDLLTSMALATTLDGLSATVADSELPDGWRQLDVDPDGAMLISPLGAMRGALQARSTSAIYVDTEQQRNLIVTALARPAASLHTQRLFLEDSEIVSVRGHEAVVGRFPSGSTDDGDGVVMSWEEGWVVRWVERPGEVLSVSSLGVDRDGLLAAAESIQPVDDGRWKELLEATSLGDLAPGFTDDRPSVEMGRGRFADGTAWVLRYIAAGTYEGGSYEEEVSLDVAITGDSNSSSSFSAVGTAIDENGNPIEVATPVFRSTSQVEKAGRAFASGLVREDVARIELRAADGSKVGDAQLVTAEGKVAWVTEVSSDVSIVVAFAADGAELGTDQLPGLSGGQEAPEPLLPGDVQDTVPAPGPTTTGG